MQHRHNGGDGKGRVLIWLLVFSLLLNLYTVMQMRGLRDRVEQLSALHNQASEILGSVSAGRRTLMEMQEESARYSRPGVEVSGFSADGMQADMRITWTFRELDRDAHVALAYRVGDQQWHQAEVEQVADTSFTANLAIPTSSEEPPFYLSFAPAARDRSTSEASGSSSAHRLEYVISASHGDVKRTGDIHVEDIARFTGYFVAEISEEAPGGRYTMSVYQRGFPAGLENVNAVDLMLYQDSESISSRLQYDGTGWEGSLAFEEKYEIDRIGFAVIFKDGTRAECLTPVQ